MFLKLDGHQARRPPLGAGSRGDASGALHEQAPQPSRRSSRRPNPNRLVIIRKKILMRANVNFFQRLRIEMDVNDRKRGELRSEEDDPADATS